MNSLRAAISFLVLLCATASCREDEQPDPIQYFQIIVDDTFVTDLSEDWIMLHNKDGKLISAKRFESGMTISFDTIPSRKPEEFAVSLVTTAPGDPGTRYFRAESFFGETAGSTWTLKVEQVISTPPGSLIGNTEITVADPDLGSYLNSRMSWLGGSTLPFVQNSEFTFSFINVFDVRNDFFVFVTGADNIPRYKFLEDHAPGNYRFTLNDFNEFDVVKTYSFPPAFQSFMFVHAFPDNASVFSQDFYYANFFLNQFVNNQAPATSFNVGYLNRFSKYRTFFYAGYDNHLFTYDGYGGIPEDLDLPLTLNASVVNTSYLDYSINAGSDVVRTSTVWIGGLSINTIPVYFSWTVHDSNKGYKNPSEIPAALSASLPGFKPSDLTLDETSFYTRGSTLAPISTSALRENRKAKHR